MPPTDIPQLPAAGPNVPDAPSRPITESDSDNHGDMSDVWVGSVVAVAILISLIWFGQKYRNGTELPLVILATVCGSAMGWLIGILISPYNTREKGSFTDLSKLVYGFLSGYVVSKVDPLIRNFLPGENLSADGKRFLVLIAVSLAALITTTALTYVTRTYWRTREQG
jgi:hypothetical protein